MSYTGSIMDNCCECETWTETMEEFARLNAATSSGSPFLTVAADESELAGKNFSTDLTAGYTTIDSVAGPPPWTMLYRGKQRYDPASSFSAITGPSSVSIEIASGSLAGFALCPSSPAANYDNSLAQTAGWLCLPDNGGGTVLPMAFRTRHKINRTRPLFVFSFELWVKTSGGVFGWDNFSSRAYHVIVAKNCTLVSGDSSLAANTWYEPAMPGVTDSADGGFSDGFIGRGVTAVREEDQASWEARTGITLL